MNKTTIDLLAAALGAAMPELLFWQNAKTRLSAEKYQNLMRSPAYWAITAAMFAAAALGSWLWFYGETQPPKNFVLAGAAFPVLLKKGIAALTRNGTTHLGGQRTLMRDYWDTV